jgi:hypothetical protein
MNDSLMLRHRSPEQLCLFVIFIAHSNPNGPGLQVSDVPMGQHGDGYSTLQVSYTAAPA